MSLSPYCDRSPVQTSANSVVTHNNNNNNNNNNNHHHHHDNPSICHIGSTATKPDAAAHKTPQNKIDKYSELASTHIFYPFATETAGTWHEMATELTQEIGRRITTITEDTRETTFLFQRFSMALY